MGRLLAEGGYPREALAPTHASVELALQAMAVLIEKDGDPGAPVPAAVIHAQMVERGLLAATDAARVSMLREMVAAVEVDEKTARDLVASGESIVENAGAALVRERL
jgi:hypothetical protein